MKSSNGFKADDEFFRYSEPKPKQSIIITSRVHPGESNASYLVHGII